VAEVSPERKSGGWDGLRDLAPYLGLGLEMAVSILAALGAGYWMDGKLGTRPTFFLVGGTVGVAAALYHFLRTVLGSKT
jgi:hypothetical protein